MLNNLLAEFQGAKRVEEPSSQNRLYHSGRHSSPYLLRNLLLERIKSTPSGGWIKWCTYYFCDQLLVEALLDAHRRGVDLLVLVEDCPRTPVINQPTIRQLSSELGSAHFRSLRACSLLPCMPASFRLRANLHAKVYAFSHPQPHVLLGSYNPSCDVASDPELVESIGDQDLGYNLLAEFRQPDIAEGLAAHLRHLFLNGHKRLFRFWPGSNTILTAKDTQVILFPRCQTQLLQKRLNRLGNGDRLFIAASHMKVKSIVKAISKASRAGARVEIICHDSERRVPQKAIERLRSAGVSVQRYLDAERAPMHYKFICVETIIGAEVWFGSFNLNAQSLYCNHEVLVRSCCPAMVAEFKRCWSELVNDVRAASVGNPDPCSPGITLG